MTAKRAFPKLKAFALAVTAALLCAALLVGCAEPAAPEESWEQSPYADADFAGTGFLMEMAYEVFGPEDEIFAYTIANTTMEPSSFDDAFSLEYRKDGLWLTVPMTAAFESAESHELPSLQMCKVEAAVSLFDAELQPGSYRIVREVGGALCAAEFAIAEQRPATRDMSFGYAPLSELPPDYDAADAQADACYTIAEDGVKNQEAVQRFADKVSLGLPAKLRTLMLAEDGAVIIRDIIYGFAEDGTGSFLVICDNSRASSDTDEALTERTYSHMSVAEVGNKSKVCLSDYVSYRDEAPVGAPFELLSPDAADNIDLVATIELRVEETRRQGTAGNAENAD